MPGLHSFVSLSLLLSPTAAIAAVPTETPAVDTVTLPLESAASIAPLLAPEAEPLPSVVPPLIGPPAPEPARIRPAVEESLPGQRFSFGERVGSVKWELLGAVAVLTATNIRSVGGETQSFRFVDEGFFGRNTGQVGLDKLAHAWNGYVFTDVLYKRMARKVGGGAKTAWTAAALGMALQTYGEIYDGFHRGSGFSWQDMGFNAAGVGFSVLRHTVPGVAEKVDYRTYFVPVNRPEGLGDPDRFEKQRFLLAVKGSGFAGINRTPLRFLELHLGYRGKNFSVTDRKVGLTPERRVFVGIGFNLSEALFKNRSGWASSVARSGLEYFQLPYTAVHADLTK